jgi:hypothetical protein
MPIRSILLGLGAAAAIVHVATFIMIMAWLDRHGHKTSIVLARIYFYKYVKAYRDQTVKETGKPGPLYRVCIGAIQMALVFAVAGVIMRAR